MYKGQGQPMDISAGWTKRLLECRHCKKQGYHISKNCCPNCHSKHPGWWCNLKPPPRRPFTTCTLDLIDFSKITDKEREQLAGFHRSKVDATLSSLSQDSYIHNSCQTCPEALYKKNTFSSHAQESSIKTDKQKTTIEEVEDEESTPLGHFQKQPKEEKPKPFSSLWVLSQLRRLAAEAGIGTLKQWVHDQKQWEVDRHIVKLLLNIPTMRP